MKPFFTLLLFFFFAINASAQDTKKSTPKIDTTKKVMIVEAACGQCMFEMKDKDCNLAVRMNGQTYFVDGTNIDAHGDAHSSDGFCNKIRKAKVQGEVVDNRFKATYFLLLPVKKE